MLDEFQFWFWIGFSLKDRSGDTNLIHAAKAGHKSIVEALLKKYADVDMTGKVFLRNDYYKWVLCKETAFFIGKENGTLLGSGEKSCFCGQIIAQLWSKFRNIHQGKNKIDAMIWAMLKISSRC